MLSSSRTSHSKMSSSKIPDSANSKSKDKSKSQSKDSLASTSTIKDKIRIHSADSAASTSNPKDTRTTLSKDTLSSTSNIKDKKRIHSADSAASTSNSKDTRTKKNKDTLAITSNPKDRIRIHSADSIASSSYPKDTRTTLSNRSSSITSANLKLTARKLSKDASSSTSNMARKQSKDASSTSNIKKKKRRNSLDSIGSISSLKNKSRINSDESIESMSSNHTDNSSIHSSNNSSPGTPKIIISHSTSGTGMNSLNQSRGRAINKRTSSISISVSRLATGASEESFYSVVSYDSLAKQSNSSIKLDLDTDTSSYDDSDATVKKKHKRYGACKFAVIVGLSVLGLIIIIALFIAIPSAMILIGAVYINDCPARPMVPIFLIVAGVLVILRDLIAIFYRLQKRRQGEHLSTKHVTWLELSVDGLTAIWFILGCFWIYGLADWDPDDDTSPRYCASTLHTFASFIVTVACIVFGMACLYMCTIVNIILLFLRAVGENLGVEII